MRRNPGNGVGLKTTKNMEDKKKMLKVSLLNQYTRKEKVRFFNTESEIIAFMKLNESWIGFTESLFFEYDDPDHADLLIIDMNRCNWMYVTIA